MNAKQILKDNKLELYVKDIIVLESNDETKKNRLPFFADGYPGIVFQQSCNGVFRHPQNKKLSNFFLYGQTIHPIELSIAGVYRLIVFQLYPFAAKTLFGVNPKELNDDCYDIISTGGKGIKQTVKKVFNATETTAQVEIIAAFLSRLVKKTINYKEQRIQIAINLILNSKGKIIVKALTENLHTTERTLQRQFIEYVGISPKQFSKIIQFQFSLNQISDEMFSKLSDIVYDNGFADQSHFIRSFKKFTGKKPSQFKKLK